VVTWLNNCSNTNFLWHRCRSNTIIRHGMLMIKPFALLLPIIPWLDGMPVMIFF